MEDQGTEETTETVEAPEGGEEITTETPEATNGEWRDTIQDEGARKFADSFTTPGAGVEAAYKFRQQLSKAIVVPGEDADDGAKAEFRKKMGVPEEA